MMKEELEEILSMKDSGLTVSELINILLTKDGTHWTEEFERGGKSG